MLHRRALLLTLPTLALIPQSPAAQRQQPDRVQEQLLAEFVRLAKELRSRAPRADTVAALATAFRLQAAHAQATGLDQVVTRSVGRLVRQRGQEALLNATGSVELMDQHHKTLESFGLSDHLPMETLSRAQHAAALARILEGGALVPVFQQAASALEALRERIARNTLPNGAVLIQEYPGGICPQLNSICTVLSAAANIVCLGSAIDPLLFPICAALVIESAAACLAAWAMGC